MAETVDKISTVGDVEVTELKLITSENDSYDLTAIVADITLYEDLFSNTMSGYVLVEDALDLISTLNLVGEEILSIELKTPTLEHKIVKKFYIYKLQYRKVNKRSQTYMLSFCSRELITSTNSKVAKAFSGNIGDTVNTIFKDTKYIGSTHALMVERPKNSYSFIAPYWTPFETINWLSAKTLNKDNVSNYLFYETNKSFEYASIDFLMQQFPKRSYVYTDMDSNTILGTNGNIEDRYNIVESIENNVTFDYLRNLSAGMYASKLYTFDLTSKIIHSTGFDYLTDFDKSAHLNDEPLKTVMLPRKKVSSLHFIDKNNYQTGSYKAQGYSDFYLQRNSLLEQISAFKFVIKVYGRTDINVGNTVYFATPDLKQILKDKIAENTQSQYFSGKYLITAIRHQIINGIHTMYMEIVSDSFLKKVANS